MRIKQIRTIYISALPLLISLFLSAGAVTGKVHPEQFDRKTAEKLLRELADDRAEHRLRAFHQILSRADRLRPEILAALKNREQRPWAIFILGFLPDQPAREALEKIIQDSPRGEERYLAVISLSRQLRIGEHRPGRPGTGEPSPFHPVPEAAGYLSNLIDNLARYQEIIIGASSGPWNFAFNFPLAVPQSFPPILFRSPSRLESNIGRILVQALQDEDWRVRLAACEALFFSVYPESVEPLARRLRDSEWQVRQSAARALGERRDRKAAPYLIAQLKIADYLEREDLVKALGKIGGLDVVEALIERFREDENKDVKQAALFCLATITERTGDDAIVLVIEERERREENEEVLDKIKTVLKQLRGRKPPR